MLKTTASILTIDGPSGSGKGTVARRVADELGWHLLDSGALYRLVGLAAHKRGVTPGDEAALSDLAQRLDVSFGMDAHGNECILLAGAEVTGEIRSEAAGERASVVAAIPGVRAALLERQRRFAVPPGLVADGRDMGTVVFPDAPLKIYLTATAEERAQRRYNQLKDKGLGVSLPALSREVAERDHRDLHRPIAPLRPAADAVTIDSTDMSIAEVVARVVGLWKERAASLPT